MAEAELNPLQNDPHAHTLILAVVVLIFLCAPGKKRHYLNLVRKMIGMNTSVIVSCASRSKQSSPRWQYHALRVICRRLAGAQGHAECVCSPTVSHLSSAGV